MIHKAKKSLGQNFLKSEQALNTICTASGLNNDDIILEIGPGKGALTKKLLEKAKQVIAIEKDHELIYFLQDKFKSEIESKKLILINEDILDFEITKYKIESYKIIANIPYNITGAILKKFLSAKTKPFLMSLLIQKEVAERIIARDKKESILSLSVKAYGDSTYVMKVHKRFFSPSPKVDSAIITIKNISANKFESKKEEELFFQIIKIGFAHKRKILKKNLGSIIKNNDDINICFEKLKIDPKNRAEDIPFETWLMMTKYFSKNL